MCVPLTYLRGTLGDGGGPPSCVSVKRYTDIGCRIPAFGRKGGFFTSPFASFDSERMVSVPTTDVYKVSLFTHSVQRQFVNTFYYEVGGVTVVDDFEEADVLADTWVNKFLTTYRSIISDDVTFGCLKVEKVKGPRIPRFIKFFTDTKGSRVGEPMPDNLTLVIRRRGGMGVTARRSLLHISGIRTADTLGSFLQGFFIVPTLNDFVALLNDQLVASPGFNSAEFNPVIPQRVYAYARNVNVFVNVAANTLTLQDGDPWDIRGFVNGGRFRILAPSKNKGTYTALTAPLSPAITLSENELELEQFEIMNCQQVVTSVVYIALDSAVPQTAIRTMNRRRSSHTAVVA